MAGHDTPTSMLKESLKESLEAAHFCASYRKIDTKWGEFRGQGCLGYPSAILLFSIIDSIGSYFRGKTDFVINIGAKPTRINAEGWEHFKILNSKYFNQNLEESFIKAIYSQFRCKLTHNSILGKGSVMIPNNQSIPSSNLDEPCAFFIYRKGDGSMVRVISIEELYLLCSTAIDAFLEDVDEIVPNSKVGRKFT